MQDKIVLIDYEEKYADTINEIEEEQWGKWCTGDIRDEIGTHTHIKLVKVAEEIAEIAYGKRVGDAFYIQVIVIKPKYQHHHIGSIFMEYFINYAKTLELANIVCEGVLVNNKMNIENIMKKYDFKEILELKNIGDINFQTPGVKNVAVILANAQM